MRSIRVSVSFPDTILEVTTNDPALPFIVTSGGNGSKAVSGTIQRLVPDESLYLYFAVKNPEGPIPGSYQKFVARKGIVYKGGMADEGRPSDVRPIVLLVFGTAFFLIIEFTLRARAETAKEQVRMREKVVLEVVKGGVQDSKVTPKQSKEPSET